jgi:phenylacetic acid degradation operon negative regulatory protein
VTPLLEEPLQPQDLVITLLGTYVRPFGELVWSGGLVALLDEFGFSHGAARVALTRLVRRGLLSRERTGRLVHYRITARCQAVLAEGDGRIFSLGSPPSSGDCWTLLWHQIPEDRRLERSRVARRLRFLGFGSVQDSVWVSPHDHVREVGRLLQELGVSEFATVFASVPRGLTPLVARAWDLGDLVQRYEAFVAEFSGLAGPRARGRLSDREAFITRTRVIHLFRGFPFLDPELPEELAPISGAREEAVSLFHTLFGGLAEPSQRHFDAVTAAPEPIRDSGSRSRPRASAARPPAARR